MLHSREIVQIEFAGNDKIQQKLWEDLLFMSSHVNFKHLEQCSSYKKTLLVDCDYSSDKKTERRIAIAQPFAEYLTESKSFTDSEKSLTNDFYVGFMDFDKELLFLCTIHNNEVSFSFSDTERTFISNLMKASDFSVFSVRKERSHSNQDHYILSNALGTWVYPLLINGINVGNMVIQDLKRRKQTYIFQNLEIRQGNTLLIDWPYGSIYFDLDDTLIFKGSKNDKCFALAEMNRLCGNDNILITRNPNNIKDTFEGFGMDLDLFDSVIQIKGKLRKSNFFNQNEISAFIDNEFLERLDVAQNTTSHVFDLDCIDILTESLKNFGIKS